jgi:uroporphyrinogen-III synthase
MSKLKGIRVVVTRPKSQSSKFIQQLADLGATPISLPVIEIGSLQDYSKLDAALSRLDEYDWLVLTSVNGVEAVWARLAALQMSGLPKTLKTACIGPKTAAALRQQGVEPAFVPDSYTAEAILPGLGQIEGVKVLLTRADIARDAFPEAIRAAGGTADDITAYRTLHGEPNPDGLEKLRAGVDVVTFTSPSTVRNFAALLDENGLDIKRLPGEPIFACIGPITAQAAKEIGLPVTILPETYTADGLLDAIIQYFKGE